MMNLDTNVLVRALMQDEPVQAAAAEKLLAPGMACVVTLPVLCEVAWVLRGTYQLERSDIADALRALLAAANLQMNRPAVEAGLKQMDLGGGFADGVAAYEGRWLGATSFVSFDRKAVTLLQRQGFAAQLP